MDDELIINLEADSVDNISRNLFEIQLQNLLISRLLIVSIVYRYQYFTRELWATQALLGWVFCPSNIL